MKIRHFAVRGTGYFPLDMLRHDCCWPTTSKDAVAMNFDRRFDSHRDVRVVELSTIGSICNERWASFGWHVFKEPHGDLSKR